MRIPFTIEQLLEVFRRYDMADLWLWMGLVSHPIYFATLGVLARGVGWRQAMPHTVRE